MGRKNIRTDDPVEPLDTKIPEVVLELKGAGLETWPSSLGVNPDGSGQLLFEADGVNLPRGSSYFRHWLAPAPGLEPGTRRLTAACSTD